MDTKTKEMNLLKFCKQFNNSVAYCHNKQDFNLELDCNNKNLLPLIKQDIQNHLEQMQEANGHYWLDFVVLKDKSNSNQLLVQLTIKEPMSDDKEKVNGFLCSLINTAFQRIAPHETGQITLKHVGHDSDDNDEHDSIDNNNDVEITLTHHQFHQMKLVWQKHEQKIKNWISSGQLNPSNFDKWFNYLYKLNAYPKNQDNMIEKPDELPKNLVNGLVKDKDSLDILLIVTECLYIQYNSTKSKTLNKLDKAIKEATLNWIEMEKDLHQTDVLLGLGVNSDVAMIGYRGNSIVAAMPTEIHINHKGWSFTNKLDEQWLMSELKSAYANTLLQIIKTRKDNGNYSSDMFDILLQVLKTFAELRQNNPNSNYDDNVHQAIKSHNLNDYDQTIILKMIRNQCVQYCLNGDIQIMNWSITIFEDYHFNIMKNIRLAMAVATRYQRMNSYKNNTCKKNKPDPCLNWNDLYMEAMKGLIKGLDKYAAETSPKHKQSTYVSWHATQHVKKLIKNIC